MHRNAKLLHFRGKKKLGNKLVPKGKGTSWTWVMKAISNRQRRRLKDLVDVQEG